jgi:hypothetical protein
MRVRIGVFVVVAAVLSVGACGDAAAKQHHQRHLHARRSVVESRAQLVPRQPVRRDQVRLGAMRYYGGPKSPMWRGPAEY